MFQLLLCKDSLWSRVIYTLESQRSLSFLGLLIFSLYQMMFSVVTIAKDIFTQFVIPVAFVDVVLQVLHDALSAGHLGRDGTLAAAWSKYY